MSVRGFRSLLGVMGAGFEPVGVVMGATAFQLLRPRSCVVSLGRMGTEPLIFPAYEDALRESWRGAFDKLEAEAVRVGAHGVVGVSVVRSDPTTIDPTTVVRLTGSAVRIPGEPPLDRPFVSMVSMEDTLKLLLRGWVPSGIVCGISAVHVHGWASSSYRQRTPFVNAELVAPSAGMKVARTRAEHEVRTALRRHNAQGSVGSTVGLTRFPQACGSNQGVLIEAIIFGTAVVRYGAPVAAVSAVRDLARAGSR